MPEALPTIGPYMIAADVLPMDQKHLEQEMAAKIAKRLLTVCLSFDELPAIRYQHGQTCAQHVATALNGLFDGMERARDGPKCVTGPLHLHSVFVLAAAILARGALRLICGTRTGTPDPIRGLSFAATRAGREHAVMMPPQSRRLSAPAGGSSTLLILVRAPRIAPPNLPRGRRALRILRLRRRAV